MPASNAERTRKRRAALRAEGLRPAQIWVPDSRRPEFTERCRRETALAAAADRADPELMAFMDAALEDLGDWE